MANTPARSLTPQALAFCVSQITFGIKKRIADSSSKIRSSDANFLVYALLDGVVDTASSALQRYASSIRVVCLCDKELY